MHTICKNEAELFVWLGEADQASNLAMNTVSNIHEVMEILPKYIDDYDGAFAHLGLSPPDDSVWLALSNLCNRSWMQRLWVMQEVVFAEDLTVFCGPIAMKWNIFAQFCCDLDRFYKSVQDTFRHDSRCWNAGSMSVSALECLRRDRLSDRGTVDFTTAVVLGRKRRCEHPVEHV